ncbi:MAG: L-threonylcarbamoyladenylate synthase [Bacteroidota bacterium]
MAQIGTDIKQAASLLANGQVVAIPTETVYGLSANGLDESAVARIFEVKGRPTTNPLILHFPTMAALKPYVTHIPPLALQLARRFWPGPLTLLLPKHRKVPQIITAGLPDVAVRVPNHPLTLALLQQTAFPLAAPSANPFGYISPTKAEHVEKQLGDQIPYILDGGDCQRGLESTIIGFKGDQPLIHRLGAIPLEQLQAETPGVEWAFHTLEKAKPLTPGMLPFHYSPKTRLLLVDDLKVALQNHPYDKTGIISLSQRVEGIPDNHQIQLSLEEDLTEAGRHLYKSMHQLDALGLEVILVERLPQVGLGKTMNDRLARAAMPRPMDTK